MKVLAIDPGAKPGFCYIYAGDIQYVTYDPAEVTPLDLDELVIEDQFIRGHIYRAGKRTRVSAKSQITLVRTAMELFLRWPAKRKYRIGADAWRRVLWPGATRLSKPVVLARLRPTLGQWVEDLPKTHQADCLEACGIAMAWARLTPEQKEVFRAG